MFSKIGPVKNQYRLFNIPKNLSGNDVGSLEHVITRRIKYYDDLELKPDLLLIDGGKTQLQFVKSVLDKTKHRDIKVVAIAKGAKRIRATETIISNDGIIELDKYSKSYLILQEIRDESHRFAIQKEERKKNYYEV